MKYTHPVVYKVTAVMADVRGEPKLDILRGKTETQLVHGELFIVTEEANEKWLKGTTAHDDYPGYIQKSQVLPFQKQDTHVVTARYCMTFQAPTIKSIAGKGFSFGSRVTVTENKDGFCKIDNNAWLHHKQLIDAAAVEPDYIATARKFLETPYYWGGRSGFGIDCSGLVQVCLARAGINVLRDTNQQENTVGKQADKPQAGDIVYFPGHVGFMADDKNLLHANAFHMKTVIEPLDDVVKRGAAITAIRRL